MLFGYSFLSSTYLFCPSDRYLQILVTLYNRNEKRRVNPGVFIIAQPTVQKAIVQKE